MATLQPLTASAAAAPPPLLPAAAVAAASSSSPPLPSSYVPSPFFSARGVSLAAGSSFPLLPPEVSSSRAAEIKKAAALRHERLSGRAFEAMRPVYMHTRFFAASSGAAGSAYVSLGNTKVTCAVYGPRPSLLSATSECGKVNVDIRVSPFAGADEAAAVERNKAGGSTEEGLLTTALQQALERVMLLSRYPKAFIDVCLLILEDAGGVLAAALTCAGLAVADAGLEMLDVLTGASACGFTLVDPSTNRRRALALLDPEPEEKSAVDGDDLTVVDVAFCPGISCVCFAHARGPLLSSAGFAQQLFSLCEAACEALAEEVRDCLRNSFTSRQRLCVVQQQQSGSAHQQQEKQQSDSECTQAKAIQV